MLFRSVSQSRYEIKHCSAICLTVTRAFCCMMFSILRSKLSIIIPRSHYFLSLSRKQQKRKLQITSYVKFPNINAEIIGNSDKQSSPHKQTDHTQKTSCVSREQKEIQEVIDVLYKAIKIIDKNNKAFSKNISHIKAHLKQHKSNQYVSN